MGNMQPRSARRTAERALRAFRAFGCARMSRNSRYSSKRQIPFSADKHRPRRLLADLGGVCHVALLGWWIEH
jgi:hypothetical protein